MALSALSGDEAGIVFSQLCDALEPRIAVAFSSIGRGLREPTQAQRLQLRVDHQAAAALCHKVGWSCKELREAKAVDWINRDLTAGNMATLGSLGSVLPALEVLFLVECREGAAGPDGVQRLAEGLGAGTSPAVTDLSLIGMHIGNAGASALAAALGRGALPRLKTLNLGRTAIGDAGLVALAPALRQLPVLEQLILTNNFVGDEGLAAVLAPAPPAGALPPPTGGLAKLKKLELSHTQVTNAGCAALSAALGNGALPALTTLSLHVIPASAAAKAAVDEALARAARRKFVSAACHS